MPANQDDREELARLLRPLFSQHGLKSDRWHQIGDAIIAAGFSRSAKDEGLANDDDVESCARSMFAAGSPVEFWTVGCGEETRERFRGYVRGVIAALVQRGWRPLPAPPPTQADAGEGAAGVEG